MMKRRRPLMGAGQAKGGAGRMPVIGTGPAKRPARQGPAMGASPMKTKRFQRPVQRPGQIRADPRRSPRAMQKARARSLRMSGLQQRAAVERRAWSSVPVIGAFIDLIRNIIYPRERFRVAERRTFREKAQSLNARRRGKALVAESKAKALREFKKMRKGGNAA